MEGKGLYIISIILTLLAIFACTTAEPELETRTEGSNSLLQGDDSFIDSSGQTISQRFQPNDGFIRSSLPENSFGYYLRHLPLKPVGTKVYHFDGREKYNQSAQAAVIDMDVGARDLQQCADAVMRLRAEFLWGTGAYSDISFQFTNGFAAPYVRWRNGERIRVSGNKVNWVGANNTDTSYRAFRKYLNMIFAYAGTLSLARELRSKSLTDIEVGDVLIQGGSPGHAVIVVDKVVHPETNAVRILLAQSYMPAQDIHVLNNPQRDDPWYPINAETKRIITPEWTFYAEDLKSF